LDNYFTALATSYQLLQDMNSEPAIFSKSKSAQEYKVKCIKMEQFLYASAEPLQNIISSYREALNAITE
jgi:hypothetical protein